MQTAFQHVRLADSPADIPEKPLRKRVPSAHQGNAFHLAVPCVQAGEQPVNDCLLMHHPAENDMLISRTMDKIVQEVANIVHHHLFRLLGFTTKGWASQHQSPSRNTDLSSFLLKSGKQYVTERSRLT